MKQLIKKIAKYSKTERIQRLIELSVRGDACTPLEFMEISMIQAIRETNGECDEVRRQQELNGNL